MKHLKDKKVMFIFILIVILVGLHTWQFIKSNYQLEPLVNLIMCVLYIPLLLIFGFNSLSYFLLGYAFIWLPFESFDNYTSLFLLCSAISLNKKTRYCFIPYVIETITCYMMKKMAISHITITLIYIIFFWGVYVLIQGKHADVQPLDLKPDEELILSELAKGKMQKELECFSHVTISKKLKDARERNNCISTDELVTKYKSSIQRN